MCDQDLPERIILMQGWLTPNFLLSSAPDKSEPSRLIHFTSSSVSLAAYVFLPRLRLGHSRMTSSLPNAQVCPRRMFPIVCLCTPNILAISGWLYFPEISKDRMWATCSCVSFDILLASPPSLPFSDECRIFSLQVHHSRLSRRLSARLKLMWLTLVFSGSGGCRCAVATSRCIRTGLNPEAVVLQGKFTVLYPVRCWQGFSTLPFMDFLLSLNFTSLSNDLTLPRLLTSYPGKSTQGSQTSTSSSTSNLSVGLSPSLRLLTKRCGYFCRARNSSTARRINSATATSFCKANSRSFSRIGAGR